MSDRHTADNETNNQTDEQTPESSDDVEQEDDEIGTDPKHPHPQDRPIGDRSDTDDDTPVERYRDSPGLGASDAADPDEIPEPNEPA